MAIALLIVGAAIAAVGLYMTVVSFNDARTAARRAQEAHGQVARQERGVSIDVGEVLKQINELLGKVEQRYRVGLVLLILGAVLMIVAFAVK